MVRQGRKVNGKKYRTNSLVIEAVQFDPYQHPWPEGVVDWTTAGVQPRDMSFGYIETLEGRMHVMAGDWIITGEQDLRSLCKDDIFKATYEPV